MVFAKYLSISEDLLKSVFTYGMCLIKHNKVNRISLTKFLSNKLCINFNNRVQCIGLEQKIITITDKKRELFKTFLKMRMHFQAQLHFVY